MRVPELAGDARQWGQLGLCSLTEQTGTAIQQLRFLMRVSKRRLTVFTDMLC